MPQIWPVNKGGEGYWRLFSFQADSVMMLASCQNCFLYKTDILILTGISTASELAKEKGSMIHLSQTCQVWGDRAQQSQVLGCGRPPKRRDFNPFRFRAWGRRACLIGANSLQSFVTRLGTENFPTCSSQPSATKSVFEHKDGSTDLRLAATLFNT
jgi:hypothetical protein